MIGASFICFKFGLDISKGVPIIIELFINELSIFRAKQGDDISSFDKQP